MEGCCGRGLWRRADERKEDREVGLIGKVGGGSASAITVVEEG